MAAKAWFGVRTLKVTMSVAPRSEPAVRPMGRNGTAGKTARTQNTAKLKEPRTSLLVQVNAMLKAWFEAKAHELKMSQC